MKLDRRSGRPAQAKAVVVGGSMGGLFAALLLRRAGWEVSLHERIGAELSGRGAGIVTHDELFDVLEQAGINRAAATVGVAVTGRSVFGADGTLIGEQPYRQILTSWGHLYGLLRAALPSDIYRHGSALVRVKETDDGVIALIYTSGYDGMIYAIGFLVGFPMILFLIAEPLRNLGRFTFADVAAYRLSERPVRILAGLNKLVIVLSYLIAQMVGAGKLIQLLFGLPYATAVGMVGLLMMAYVGFGGMLATTWVQIIKAVLLLSGSTLMSALILSHFGFSLEALFAHAVEIHPKGQAIMAPGGLVKDPVSAMSLGVALIFGTAGLPHILMRFFTVGDARQARVSVLVATGFITVFYTLLFVLGFGAIALVSGDPIFKDAAGGLIGGSNMVALHLADKLGGSLLLGFISAVAFSTILAVVSGLTIAGASAASHDLYARVIRRGQATEQEEVRVSKGAVIVISLAAMGLGILFENQNIAFMVGLVFAIAASANFPVIYLSVAWPGLTTRGAVSGSLVGLISALVLVALSPGVWTTTLGLGQAPFPYDNPALFSVPLAFLVTWLVSRLDQSVEGRRARAAFEAQHVAAHTGFFRSTTPSAH